MQWVRQHFAIRLGYVLAALSALLIPLHFYAPCDVSVALFGANLVLLLITLTLSLLTPRLDPRRFQPLAFAFAALLGHLLSTH